MKKLIVSLVVFSALVSCMEEKEGNVKKQETPMQTRQTQLLAQKITPGIPKGFVQRDYCMDTTKQFAYTTIMLPNAKRSFVLEIDLAARKASLLPFSGVYKDLEPMLSPDNKKLLFASNRPLYEGDSTNDFNLWYAEKTEQGWGAAKAFDTVINTEGDEFYPSMSRSGDLYFTAVYNGRGKDDLYCAVFREGKYALPEVLSFCAADAYEFNSFISPNGQQLLFSALGYADEWGGGDLYSVLRDSTGNWGVPHLLNEKVNTSGLDYSPFVLHDTLYFTSKRMDERWTDRKFTYMVEIKMMADSTGIGEQGIYFLPLQATGFK
jgi:hypothetical protein